MDFGLFRKGKRILVIAVIIIITTIAASVNGFIGFIVGIGIAFVAFTYVSIINYKPGIDKVEYLYASFEVERGDFGSSLAATNIPLVIGILYFISLGTSFGMLAILILAIFAALPFLTMWVFRKSAGSLAKHRFTLHEIIFFITGKNVRARQAAALISCLAFVIALGFELVFGAQILGVFLQVNPNSIVWISIIIAVITGLYASVGGQRTVFKTDFIQYSLLIIGMGLATLLLINEPAEAIQINWAIPSGSRLALLALIIGSLFYYPCWYLSSMDTWQRQAISSKEASAAEWQIFGGILVVIVYLFAGLIGSLEVTQSTEGGIIGKLLGWGISDKLIVRSIASIVFVGLVSALVSTADTYSVLVVQAFDVDILGNDWREKDRESLQRLMGLRRLAVFLVPIFSVVFALILSEIAFANPQSLFYVAYAGQSVLFSFVVIALITLNRDEPDYQLVITPYGPFAGRKRLVPISIVAGAIASLVVAIVVAPESPLLYIAPVIALIIPLPLLLGRKKFMNRV